MQSKIWNRIIRLDENVWWYHTALYL